MSQDEIVISGISGFYPQCSTIKELAEKLMSGEDMTTKNHNKWKDGDLGTTSKIGILKVQNSFDNQFFGLSEKQCSCMDPSTKFVLERTFEAIVDAGLSASEIRGTNTGVFYSCSLVEADMTLLNREIPDPYNILGRSRALNANRISYFYDLRGPSFTVDCEYNGGLQAIVDAMDYLKSGEIDTAIVATGSAISHPQISMHLNDLNFLDPEGNTKSFDAEALGVARGEAVVALVLQRAKDARRSHGTIVHALNIALNNRKGLLQVPIQENWTELYQEFYGQCKVDPSEVVYIEADGDANVKHDAMELNAIGDFFCKNRSKENPLLVGTVKSNIGHTEGSSNLSGISKVIISFEKDAITPNLHYKTPNPLARDLTTGTIQVVTKPTPLTGDYVAMNSHGLTGAYGHILFRRNLKTKVTPTPDPLLPRLLTVSARHEEGMLEILDILEAAPYDPEYYNIVNTAFRKEIKAHTNRGFVLLPKNEGTSIRGQDKFFSGERKPIWYVFSGMGSQWPKLGRDLLALKPFRDSIELSQKILEPHGVDLHHLITTDDETIFDAILNCFVVIVSVQVALVDVLKSLGIEPDGIIGHSVGEVSASYADGCLTHEQAILCTYYRGLASTETPVIQGMMAAIGKGYQQMKDLVPEGIEVACHNAADSCTISGPAEQVNEYVKKLKAEGVFAKAVNVANIPYHSKYIKDMGPTMLGYLKKVIPAGVERSPRWISTSYPESKWDTPQAKICNADYHVNNLLNQVLFEEGSRHIPSDAIVIEVAPHGLLQAILKRSLSTCTNIPLTNRNAENQNVFLLRALGQLYLKGLELNVESLYDPVEYPVSRGTDFSGDLVTWIKDDSPYYYSALQEDARNKAALLQLDQPGSIYKSYTQNGEVLLPVVTYLDLVRSNLAREAKVEPETLNIQFSNLRIHESPCLAKDRDLTVQITILSHTGYFEIEHSGVLVMTGHVYTGDKVNYPEVTDKRKSEEVVQEIGTDEFYNDLAHAGHIYEPILKKITKVTVSKNEWRATVQHDNDFKILVDAMLQLKTAFKTSESAGKIFKLISIRDFTVDASVPLSNGQGEIVLDVITEHISTDNVKIIAADFIEVEDQLIKFNKEELNVIKVPSVQFPRECAQLDSIQFNAPKVEGQQLGYSGTQKGKKVIGLAVADEKSAVITVDPVLKWDVPSKWSKDEAAAVPLNYILAYHAISIVAQLSSNQSILITEVGNKLGVACLRVALAITSQVYGAVESDEDKQTVLKLVPNMAAENIIVNKSKSEDNLTIGMLARDTKGVHVIINTGSPELINVISHAARSFGIIVELSKELFETRGKLRNTYGFLRSLSLYSCWGNNVLNSGKEEKEILQKLVAEGLARGIVAPFNAAEVRDWRHTQTVVYDNDSKVSRFECESDKAYLILGGDAYSWLAITEWFINRKANNIIVVHEEETLSSSLNKKLAELKTKANIIVKPTPKFSAQLIDHIFEVSKTKIALTMLVQEADEAVVEALCQKDTFLVTVLGAESPAIRFCKERSQKNKSTLTLLSNEPLNGKTRGFLSVFDRLLITEKNQVIQVQEKEKEDEGTFELILPSNFDQVEAVGKNGLVQVRLYEIQTCSIGAERTTEIQPLFVIPGLIEKDRLIEELRKLIIPVYIVDLPYNEKYTTTELASLVVQKVKNVGSKPFNILGVGWGGAVALEVVSQLESMGERSKLQLIAGTLVELIGKWNSPKDMEVTLLSRLFNIEAAVLAKEDSWESRLKLALPAVPTDKEIDVIKGLHTIRQRMAAVFTQERRAPLNGNVFVIAPWNIPRSLLNWMSTKDVPLLAVPRGQSILGFTALTTIEHKLENKKIEKGL